MYGSIGEPEEVSHFRVVSKKLCILFHVYLYDVGSEWGSSNMALAVKNAGLAGGGAARDPLF